MKIESYDIELDVDFEHATYRGREKIKLDSSVESIVLNCLGPVIDKVIINNQSAMHNNCVGMPETSEFRHIYARFDCENHVSPDGRIVTNIKER